MTLAVDASALIKRYLREPGRDLVLDAMAQDPVWCASAMARTEAMVALHRVAMGRHQQRQLWAALREDWDGFVVVPVDEQCLARAVEIGAAYGVRSVDSVHLAAADRLPRPVRYLTFDRQQIPAAASLGLEVISPVSP
ncbi:MAG: type II toxin-antitoxin system VapC family toxin [Acidimicrobiales bacterium]|nr:type II toxin-antitoxin system VapC family toxin [Acidimicrobiales bacterium]